jgi:predicted nicotinamide N-methyase
MTLSSLEFGVDIRDVENPLLGEYDLIIGSDVLYETAHAEQVPRFIHDDFRIDVKVIIGDPD